MTHKFDPKDDIDTQWNKWSKENPPDTLPVIDENVLRERIIKELSYVSKMDVKEYTLYQKWHEIHSKFPTESVNTVFGEKEIFLQNRDQEKNIQEAKNNIWIPEHPDSYMDLEPVLEYTDDSMFENETGLDGSVIKKERERSKDLSIKCNALKSFITNGRNNSNIGRNLHFVVKDDKTGKYLGVVTISSDFLDLTPRDQYIGWDRKLKTQGGMVNHTGIGSSIVPTQPLGYNYVGGKLLSLLCLSDEVQRLWKKQYGDIMVGVTTTSLYGNTKAGGLSQYDGLDYWQKMGFTSGSVSYEPEKETIYMIRDWLKTNHTRKYFEWYVATKPSGQPYKRDHKNRSLQFTWSQLKIPKNLTKSDHARGIYFSELYTNTNEFLRGEIKENQLIKKFDSSYESLVKIWKEKHARGRIGFLKKKNKVSHDILFLDDLIYMTWEETRAKYLDQVGR
jgi:hypothetical protein